MRHGGTDAVKDLDSCWTWSSKKDRKLRGQKALKRTDAFQRPLFWIPSSKSTQKAVKDRKLGQTGLCGVSFGVILERSTAFRCHANAGDGDLRRSDVQGWCLPLKTSTHLNLLYVFRSIPSLLKVPLWVFTPDPLDMWGD